MDDNDPYKAYNVDEDDENFNDVPEFHYDSRCPGVLNALAIHSPLIMLGAVCSISTVLYNIVETRMIHTDSQDQQHPYCTDTLYIQLLNGVCTRGQVFDLDPLTSCMQWMDTEKWKAKDAENLYRFTLYDTKAQYFEIQNKTYAVTDMTTEAETVWPQLADHAFIALGLTILNLLISVAALDTDYFHNRLGIKDVDRLVLISSTILVSITALFYANFGNMTYLQSEITVAESWTNKECDFTTTPTIGIYVMCIGAAFSLSSLLLSFSTYIYWYVFVDLFGWFIPIDEEAEAAKKLIEEEKKAQDEENKKEKERLQALANKADLEIGSTSTAMSPNTSKVAPDPTPSIPLLSQELGKMKSNGLETLVEADGEDNSTPSKSKRKVATIISPTALVGGSKSSEASTKKKAKEIEENGKKAEKKLNDNLQDQKSKEHKKTEERLAKKHKSSGESGQARPGSKSADRPGSKSADRPGSKSADRPGSKGSARKKDKSSSKDGGEVRKAEVVQEAGPGQPAIKIPKKKDK